MIDQARKLRKMAKGEKTDKPGSSSPSKTHSRIKKSGACKSIAITSGKGGVGKSNTSISLAIALTQLKKKVLIFDGDLGLANIHILLGIAPKYNLSHVLSEECDLDDVLCSGPGGITIVPGASGILSMANLEAVRLEALIRKLSRLENDYDYLLIDGGAGIGHSSIQLCTMADYTILIITQEPTSLADAYSIAKILVSRGNDKISVIVNMAESDKGGEEIFKKLRTLTRQFLKKDITLAGIIPFDRNVTKFIRAQKNIFIERKSSNFAIKTQNIARRLCGMPMIKNRGFFTGLFTQVLGEKV